MAVADWVEIYRAFTVEERAAARAKLMKEIDSFSSQSRGDKSYTKDLKEVREKLQALTRLANGAGAGSPRMRGEYGVADFSRM